MKKIATGLFFAMALQSMGYAQITDWYKGILQRLATARQDTSRILLIAELSGYYKYYFPDSALFYGYMALDMARKINYVEGEVRAMGNIQFGYSMLGNEAKALQVALQALKKAEESKLDGHKAALLAQLGRINNRVNYPERALGYLKKSKVLSDSLHDTNQSFITGIIIVESFLMLKQPDSALFYSLSRQSAHENSKNIDGVWLIYHTMLNLGKIYRQKGDTGLAMDYLQQALTVANEDDMIFHANYSIAQLYEQLNKPDSAVYFANQSINAIQGKGFYSNLIMANILLADIYGRSDPQKAYQYSNVALLYQDSLNNLAKRTSFEYLVTFDEKERQYEIDTANAAYRSRLKQYGLLAGLFVMLLTAFLLYRNVRHRQKAFTRLLKQKQETDTQKQIAEKALAELKATQSQLIQREKMAGLGELATGIAHEIQNPLNFVNNFSEINNELVNDLNAAADKGNLEEVKAIATDIAFNSEKINHHGKRADTIIKGMLQHSRATSGQKEPTDINSLVNEYLRLANHGLRAKDSSFNATSKTELDENLGKISVVPQEIGRVLLNLINNAFYAVDEKQKENPNGYEPMVIVTTGENNGKVEIKVIDNGNGISQKILDKIFQPFFTTKPAGQGTGLGLSLAYDIVKAHGGELKVETREHESTTFIVMLPSV